MASLCQICNSEPFKYRCPTCNLHSCSLACSQVHKVNCTPKPSESIPPNDAQNGIPVSAPEEQPSGSTPGHGLANPGTLTNAMRFAQLGQSKEIQELFAKHPILRSRLHEIYKFTLEEEWVEMRSFSQSRGRGRGRGQGGRMGRSRGPWTAEKGFHRGLGRVQKWRDSCESGAGGVDGEAFKRFVALVLGENATQEEQQQQIAGPT